MRSIKIPIILIFVLACIVYAPVVHYGYVWDDLIYLVDSTPYSGDAAVVNALLKPFFLSNAYYRPLVVLSLTVFPAGVSWGASVHHAINVALHALDGVLIYILAAQMARIMHGNEFKDRWQIFLFAAFFIVHPLAVEPVTWVSGRYDVAMTTFALIFILIEICCSRSLKKILFLFLTFLLGISSKESMLGLVPALFLIHILLEIKNSNGFLSALRTVLEKKWPTYVVIFSATVVYLGMRWYAMDGIFSSTQGATFSGSIHDKVNVASLAILEFFRVVLLPWKYSAPLHPFEYSSQWETLWSGIAGCAFVLILVVLLVRGYIWPFVPLVFIVAAWPALHFFGIPNGENLVSDRYALMPLALALVVAAVSFREMSFVKYIDKSRLKPLIVLISISILLFLGLFSRATMPIWQNEFTFWEYVKEKFPKSDLATANHIRLMMFEKKWDEAEAELLPLLKIENPVFINYINLMIVKSMQGHYDESVMIFDSVDLKRSSALRPDEKGVFLCARAAAEAREEKWDTARQYAQQGLAFVPLLVRCRILYISALYYEGEVDQAYKNVLNLKKETSKGMVPPLFDEIEEKWLTLKAGTAK